MEILESRTVRTSEISDPSFLRECRRSSGTGSGPQPVWILDREGTSRPVWTPVNIHEKETVQALVIGNTSRSEPVLTLYFWNRYGGPNPVEKGRILRECSPEGSERSHVLEELDLPNAGEVLEAYRQLPDLPESLREQVAAGEVSPRLFRYFYRIPELLRPDLLDFLNRDPRTFSVQDTRELAEALRRLSPDEYARFLEQIDPPEEDVNARDIGQKVLEEARKRAYPELNRRRNDFNRDLESLDLDGRIDVNPPNNFEGNYLEFSFRCERDEDLETFAEEVRKCQKLLDHV